MSTKKLLGIFIVIIFLCIGALTYLLMYDEVESDNLGDETSNVSGENINPGIEIILSGEQNEEETVLVNSGEQIESGEEGNLSGEVIEEPKDSSGETTVPENKEQNENETAIIESFEHRVEDPYVEEAKMLLSDEDYEFYIDEKTLTFVLSNSQVFIYSYEGDKITGYKKYDKYDSEVIAKIIANTNNLPNGGSSSSVKKVTYCENFVIWEFAESVYSNYTVSDIKNMYSTYLVEE